MSSRVDVSRKISAVQNLIIINKQSCSELNQDWVSAVHYLKLSEQRCSILKTIFPRAKKSALYSAVSELFFSESALFSTEILLQQSKKSALFQCWSALIFSEPALVKIHHTLAWNITKVSFTRLFLFTSSFFVGNPLFQLLFRYSGHVQSWSGEKNGCYTNSNFWKVLAEKFSCNIVFSVTIKSSLTLNEPFRRFFIFSCSADS